MHYRARSYDPRTGRFLQKDRLFTRRANAQYLYVKNNPVSSIDPLGLQESKNEAEELLERYMRRNPGRRTPAEREQFQKDINHIMKLDPAESMKVLQQYFVGVGEAGVELVSALVHPIQTAKGIYAAVSNPGETIDAVITAIGQAAKAPPDEQGRIIGNLVGGTAITAGGAAAIQYAIKSGKAGQVVAALKRLAAARSGKGVDVVLGIRKNRIADFTAFAEKHGAPFTEWEELGLVKNVPEGRFDIMFEQALEKTVSTGNKISFDLTELKIAEALAGDPTLRVGRYAAWELQQLVRNKTWFAQTEFYLNGAKLLPAKVAELGIKVVE